MLKNIINNADYVIFFPIVDLSLSLSVPNLKNLYLIYHKTPQTKPLNPYFIAKLSTKPKTEYLLEDPAVLSYINTISQNLRKKIAIMPFKPSSKTDLICQKNNWLYISNSRKTNLILEDKLNFAKICQKNKISTIPNIITTYNHQNIIKVQNTFQTKSLVIQTKTGWAGNSTFLSSQKPPIPKNAKIKLMPFLDGFTLTTNNCIFQKKLISSPPALQLNNPKHTNNIFATTGRKWPVYLKKSQLENITDINSKILKILNKLNFRGYFGLDFFVDRQDKVYLLECNPRLTASFDFYNQLEIRSNLPPLLFLHILEFLNLPLKNTDLKENRFFNSSIKGCQITIRDSLGKAIKTTTSC